MKPGLMEEQAYKKPGLREDTSGAIMIMGLFMAVFLVGMLYYIVGLGDAIAYRERMQDTSDAGTFTAAVVSARGMNLIVLLNLVMAAIMAILLSLKIIEVIIIAAMAIAAAVGFFCGGCTAPAITFLNSMRNVVSRAADAFERVAKVVINACHIGQVGIRYAWPVVGQLRAVDAMAGSAVSATPSSLGGVFPIYAQLPTEDHEFIETCLRGAQLASRIISAPFARIPIIGGKVRSFIAGAVEGLYAAYASYYCGSGDEPSPTIEVDRGKPETAESKACERECKDGGPGCSACESSPGSDACAMAVTRNCYEATQQVSTFGPRYCHPDNINREDRDVDISSGDWCRVAPTTWESCYDDARLAPNAIHRTTMSGDGSVSAPTPVPQLTAQLGCESRVDAATSQCSSGATRQISYGRYSSYVVYWRTTPPGADVCVFDAQAVPPAELTNAQRNYSGIRESGNRNTVCPDGFGPVAGGGGGRTPFRSSCRYEQLSANWQDRLPEFQGGGGTPEQRKSACEALPTSYEAARSAAGSGGGGNRWMRREVTEVYSCMRREEMPIDVEFGDRASDSPDEWKPPQRVCERTGRGAFLSTSCPSSGDGIFMGAEDFQIRGLAIAGEGVTSVADQGTRVATWNSTGGGRTSDPSANIPLFGFVRTIGQASISQAEFFWDQKEYCGDGDGGHCSGYIARVSDNREWMWDMAWTARLRRVNFDSASNPEDAAGRSSPSIGSRISGFVSAVFAH